MCSTSILHLSPNPRFIHGNLNQTGHIWKNVHSKNGSRVQDCAVCMRHLSNTALVKKSGIQTLLAPKPTIMYNHNYVLSSLLTVTVAFFWTYDNWWEGLLEVLYACKTTVRSDTVHGVVWCRSVLGPMRNKIIHCIPHDNNIIKDLQCRGHTQPQWNFTDFGRTDLSVSPVHSTWYQSSQSSHCTQLTTLCLSWGWMQSTDAQVLYMKSSSCWLMWPDSLSFDDFLAAFCLPDVRLDFLGLLLAAAFKGNQQD